MLFVEHLPRHLAAEDASTELPVLAPRPRQDAEEPASSPGDMPHVVRRSQLRISHVKEVRPADQFHQQVPGVSVGLVVGEVAAAHAEVNRDRPVGGDRQRIDQLFQVGPMIFRVPEDDRRSDSASLAPLAGCGLVRPVDGDRRAVVMQLIQTDVEHPHRVSHQRQHQRRLIAGEQLVHGAAAAIVVQPGDLLGRKSQQVRGLPGDPLAHPVERLPRNEQIPHQDQQDSRGGDFRSTVLRREVLFEKLLKLHPPHNPVHHRQGSDVVRGERLPVLSGELSGRNRSPRPAVAASSGLCHDSFSLAASRARPTAAEGRRETTFSCAKDCPVREKVKPLKNRGDSAASLRPGGREVVPCFAESEVSEPRCK
jgi:hypothetical protein